MGFIDGDIDDIMSDFEDQFDEIIHDFFDGMANEDGTLDVMELIASLLGSFTGEENLSVYPAGVAYAQGTSIVATFSSDEIIDEFVTLLLEELEEYMEQLDIIFAVMSITLLATIAIWALQFLFAVLRTLLFKRKTVFMGFTRGFGWMFFAFFVILPSILVAVLSSQIYAFVGLAVTASFASMLIASFIGSILLMLIGIFGYWRLKKRIKGARKLCKIF